MIVPFFYEIYGDAYFGRKDDAEFVQVKSPLYLQQYHSTIEEERKKDPQFEVGDYEFTSGNDQEPPSRSVRKSLPSGTNAGSPGASRSRPCTESLCTGPLRSSFFATREHSARPSRPCSCSTRWVRL